MQAVMGGSAGSQAGEGCNKIDVEGIILSVESGMN